MNKFSFPLSLISIAVLAACTTYDRATPAPGAVVVEPPKAAAVPAPAGTIVAPVVVAPAPAPVAAPSVVVPSTPALRVGNGRIESIAAGDPASGARGAASSSARRISIRMDDGSVQFVNSDAPNVAIGDRIELTGDGHIRRPGSSSVAVVTPAIEPSTVVVPTTLTLRPGIGRIESISAVPPSAAAGGSKPGSTKRLGVKMGDGSVQFVDTGAVGLALGDRIELTADGYIRRPAP
jgi:hypothetical protein